MVAFVARFFSYTNPTKAYICPRLLSRRIRPPKLIANCKWIPVSASRCTTGIVTGFPSGESPGVQWDSKNNIKVEEVNLQYVLPPFSAAVSCQWDTAVWLGDKKRIIFVRRWGNNIGPAQPIWVEDSYFSIVYTNLFCFVLSQIQNMHKESITAVEIVKTPNVQLPCQRSVACALKSGLRECSVYFRCCCVDMKNTLNIIRRILVIISQNLYLRLKLFW